MISATGVMPLLAETGRGRMALYALSLLVLLIDQASKWWIIHGLRLPEIGTVDLWPTMSLTWVENRGVSMGMLTAGSDMGRWMLVGVTAVIALIVAIVIWRGRDPVERTALALVLGGALGNIIDRARFGYVADFIHFHVGNWSFYVFNVADAAITVGVALLLLRAFTKRPELSEER